LNIQVVKYFRTLIMACV